MIKVKISEYPISADKKLGVGNSHFRFQLRKIDEVLLYPSIREEKIRLLSPKLFKNRPGFDLLDFLGIRRRVILRVEDQNGNVGCLAVNAESLRKRLGLGKSEFYQALKKGKGEMTQFLEETLRKKISLRVYLRGLDHLKGSEIVEKNPEKAFQIFKKMVDCGDLNGYVGVAACYSHGEGVLQDSSLAKQTIQEMLEECSDNGEDRRRYLMRAVLQGVKEVEPCLSCSDFNAKRDLAICYIEGRDGWPKDPKKGFQLLQEVAGLNQSSYATAYLVRCHLQGLGTEKDSEKAKNLILEQLKVRDQQEVDEFFYACARLHIEEFEELFSQNVEMAMRYIRVDLMWEHSPEKRFKFLEKARAFPEILGLIAYFHQRGEGVEKDPVKALHTLEEMHTQLDGQEKSRYEKCMQLFLLGPACLS